jgi:hypothetical protein
VQDLLYALRCPVSPPEYQPAGYPFSHSGVDLMAKTTEFETRIHTFLASTPASVVSVHLYPYFSTVRTHYRRIGTFIGPHKYSPLLIAPEDGPLFVGVHECLCIVLTRPKTLVSMMDLIKGLPYIEPFGPVTWLGTIYPSPPRCEPSPDNYSHVLWRRRFYIPTSTWNPPVHSITDRNLQCSAIVHPILDRLDRPLDLMHIPTMCRNSVLPQFTLGEVTL